MESRFWRSPERGYLRVCSERGMCVERPCRRGRGDSVLSQCLQLFSAGR